MIPKKLHYVWFGGKDEPTCLKRFKATWQKAMPDWDIVRWDESNFDVTANSYCKEAYELRKWAFASDYARLKILFDNGGIYLDTDEEIIRSLEPFLVHDAFFGMEPSNFLQAGVIGCEEGSDCLKKILRYYDTLSFVKPDGSCDLRAIGVHITAVLAQHYGFEPKEEVQHLNGGITIYPSQYFSPDLATLKIDENSYSIHRPSGSWLTSSQKLKKNIYRFITGNAALRWLYVRIYRRR